MKNLLTIFLIFLFLFFSCSIDEQNPKEKETIKEIITEKDNSLQSNYKLINTKVYPVTQPISFKFPNFATSAFAGDGNDYIDVDATTKSNDFIAGRFYRNISFYSTDPLYGNVWRTLDLSAQVGNQESKVTIYIKVIATGADGVNEIASFMFRSPDGILAPVIASAKFGDTSYIAVQTTTDEFGCIQFAYVGTNAYNAVYENHEPDYNLFTYLDCEIWIYESWKSDVYTMLKRIVNNM